MFYHKVPSLNTKKNIIMLFMMILQCLWKIVIYDDLFVWWWNGHLIYCCWCLRLVVCYMLNIWLSISPNITYVILCVVTIISDYDNIGYPLLCEHQWSFFLCKLVQNCTKNMHQKNILLQIFIFFLLAMNDHISNKSSQIQARFYC